MKRLKQTALAAMAFVCMAAAGIAYANIGQHETLNAYSTGATATASFPSTCYLEADDVTNGIPIFIACSEFLSTTAADIMAANLTLDDGSGASPSLTFTDGTDETAVFSKVDGSHLTMTITAADSLQILTGNLNVGNGTPGETINGEDLYVEGISEFDGAANFDGSIDLDGAWTIDSTTIAENGVKYAGRGVFTVCGDIATLNNNTVYYGPSQAVIDSATAGMITCNTDAAGNTTEATADEPAIAGRAIVPLGMVCYMTDMGATGSPITFTLRSAASAYDAGAITLSIADNILSGASPANTIGTTEIAANATVSVALSSSGDVGAGAFICRVEYAY